jgi:hypothetical protein
VEGVGTGYLARNKLINGGKTMEENLYRTILRAFVESRGSIHTADRLLTDLIEFGVIEANDPEIFKFEETWAEMTAERDGE